MLQSGNTPRGALARHTQPTNANPTSFQHQGLLFVYTAIPSEDAPRDVWVEKDPPTEVGDRGHG